MQHNTVSNANAPKRDNAISTYLYLRYSTNNTIRPIMGTIIPMRTADVEAEVEIAETRNNKNGESELFNNVGYKANNLKNATICILLEAEVYIHVCL